MSGWTFGCIRSDTRPPRPFNLGSYIEAYLGSQVKSSQIRHNDVVQDTRMGLLERPDATVLTRSYSEGRGLHAIRQL